MFLLIKNAHVYTPADLGVADVLVANERIITVRDRQQSEIPIDLPSNLANTVVINAEKKIVTPGLIDQHMHFIGAGGKNGFASMTKEIDAQECFSSGITCAVGLLGTDGTTRTLQALFAKAKKLEMEGLSTYIYTSYFGLPPISLMDSVMEDLVYIDKVIGAKLALCDPRCSFPSEREILRLLRQVRVGAMIAGKKGILHIHLGGLPSGMQILLDIVNKHNFPIENISPTHVGRTKELFAQALDFARLGGMIDITTGASKFTEPHQQVMLALDQGISSDQLTFSSDGHAGLSRPGKTGESVLDTTYPAPLSENLTEMVHLIKHECLRPEISLKLLTVNPARNLGLSDVCGSIAAGLQADFCIFNEDWQLEQIISQGKLRAITKGQLPPKQI